ncbi:MAG: DUF2336 domain-containing protein [Alphaproteobacteria bacterium]|nr:DUF2336 domain-containing protein [Alphaproteobacteria bacterium]MBP9876985.1 DUF2336 domain-containing protein [Alphaproteobacteria bacterium]
MTNNKVLSVDDVQILLKDPSDSAKASLGEKVASQIDNPELSDAERTLAVSIIEHLAQDTAVIIRKALAHNLKTSRTIPRDVALKLANDIADVSLPIIEYSSVLTDEDLISIIDTGSAEKQIAVARRPVVSNRIVGALIETNNEDVVVELVSNPGADIQEQNYSRVIEKFPKSERIHEGLITKRKLSPVIQEKLMHLVSDHLKTQLTKLSNLSVESASELVDATREKETISRITSIAAAENMESLVRSMAQQGRLTPSIILRAICLGDINFFEHAIALLGQVPLYNAKILIYDTGKSTLETLLRKSRIPENLIPAFVVAVNVRKETDYDGGENDQIRFRRRMIERILTQYEGMGEDNLNYLLNKFSDLVDAAA